MSQTLQYFRSFTSKLIKQSRQLSNVYLLAFYKFKSSTTTICLRNQINLVKQSRNRIFNTFFTKTLTQPKFTTQKSTFTATKICLTRETRQGHRLKVSTGSTSIMYRRTGRQPSEMKVSIESTGIQTSKKKSKLKVKGVLLRLYDPETKQ